MSEPDRILDYQWWKLVLVGASTLAGLIVITTITGELPDGWWVVAMGVLLFSILTIATGVVLGGAQLVRSRTARP